MKIHHILFGLGLGLWCMGISILLVGQEKVQRPSIQIPYLPQKPTIDGILEENEWKNATKLTGFIGVTGNTAKKVVPEQSYIYLGHDQQNLYVGVWCVLPPGVKPTMKYRRHDSPVYMDRYQMEIWVTPPIRSHLTAYQIIGNAYGAIFDAKHIPALGSVTTLWNSNAQFKNSYKKGEYWMAEMALPLSDFGTFQPEPEDFWGIMVGLAWPQRSWPYTFGWYKNVDTHAKAYLSSNSTCVRLNDISGLVNNQMDIQLSLLNDEEQSITFHIEARVGNTQKVLQVPVPKKQIQSVHIQEELPPWPQGKRDSEIFFLKVTANNKVLLDGNWLFTPIPRENQKLQDTDKEVSDGWKFSSRIEFAPRALGLQLWTDLLDYPKRQELHSVLYTIRHQQTKQSIIQQKVTNFAYDAAETLIWLPKDLPFGEYEAQVQFIAHDGSILEEYTTSSFTHKNLKEEFIWLDTDYGEKITVAPPFEPIRIHAPQKSLQVWGRNLRFEGALPNQIENQNVQMLADPISLILIKNGHSFPAKIKKPFYIQQSTPERVKFEGSYEGGGYEFQLQGTFEFDGMLLYHCHALVMNPEETATVERLYLSVKVKPEYAKYWFTTAGGWSPALGYIPTDPQPQPIWTSLGFADLLPYGCFTDDDRAIHWFTDHAHEWILDKKVPFAEVWRTPSGAEWRVNIIQKPGNRTPFQATFGFIASPIKPLPLGWRAASMMYYPLTKQSRINFFFGPGHGGCPIDPHDTAKLCKVWNIDFTDKNPDEVLLNTSSDEARKQIKTPEFKAYIEKTFKKEFYDTLLGLQRAQETIQKDPETAVRRCWFFNASMYFEGNRSKAFRTFFPAEWRLEPSSGWFHLTTTEDYQDFFSFYMYLWFKHWYMPGLYFDECYLGPDYNVFNGNGKVMEDGTIRPSIPLLRQRSFLNRMRQLYLDHQQKPFIWVHTSNYMAPHAISATDVAMFGEDKNPTTLSDIIDTIPPILFLTFGRSQKFGFVPFWMNQVSRGGHSWDWYARQALGWAWMHDSLMENNPPPCRIPNWLRCEWGIDHPELRFIPYWNNREYIQIADNNFLVSLWLQPRVNQKSNKVLLMVMNLHRKNQGKTQTQLSLLPSSLGLSSPFKVYDMETDPQVIEWMDLIRTAWSQSTPGDSNSVKEAFNRIFNNQGKGSGKNLRDFEKMVLQLSYNPQRWKVVSDNQTTFTVTVPPRDFVMLSIE